MKLEVQNESKESGGKQIYNGLLTPENHKRNQKESFLWLVKYVRLPPLFIQSSLFYTTTNKEEARKLVSSKYKDWAKKLGVAN